MMLEPGEFHPGASSFRVTPSVVAQPGFAPGGLQVLRLELS